jgi:cell division septal protein FtsQ
MTENENKNEYATEFSEDQQKDLSRYIVQRRLQKNQMERKVRQSQMWLGRLRTLTGIVLIVLLALGGYSLLNLPQWYLNKNIFSSTNNKSLEILNNKIVSSSKILGALRRTQLPNIPVYRLETDDIKNNIMQLDPIEDVYIRRFWFPARLQIIVKEKIPVLTVSPAENVPPIAFFTKGGKLIGRDYLPLPKSFNTTMVLSYGTKGDDYKNWNNDKINLIEKVIRAVEDNAGEKVEYIDFRNPKDVYVKLKTVFLRLGQLDDTVFERINRISSILPQVKTLDKKIKYVDLRWQDTNYIKLAD